MGSKLVIILDDLLWVLTDSQLKAALHFLDSLAGLVQKATTVTRKVKAARKLEVRGVINDSSVFKKVYDRSRKYSVFNFCDGYHIFKLAF